MREQIEQRLTALRTEHEAGLRMLADLENRRAELQQTLLRIDGAVQVLEELLGPDQTAENSATVGAASPSSAAAHATSDGRVPVGAAAG